MARQRGAGCFTYGCLVASIVSTIVALALGLFLYYEVRKAVEIYISTTPMPIATISVAPEIAKSGAEKIMKFIETAKDPNGSGDFDLTADEINGAIAENQKLRDLFKDRVRITFPDDELQVDFSVKVGDLTSWSALSWLVGGDMNRYISGSARGTLLTTKTPMEVHLTSLILNEQSLPAMTLEQASSWMTGALESLVQSNTVESNTHQSTTTQNGENQEVSVLSRVKNFTLKDGHLLISLVKRSLVNEIPVKESSVKENPEAAAEE